MQDVAEETKQLIHDFVDVFNGDFSKLDVVAEDIDLYDPGLPEGELHGFEAFEGYVREMREAFPDLHIAVEEMLAGEGLVMAQWRMTATHEGEFNDVPPTGRQFEITGMSKIRIDEGQIQEDRVYYNVQEMLQQLGLTE